MAEDRELEETLRDIRAARADLTGRRDHLVAEYDDRLAALERLGDELQSGETPAKQVQAQVRKLISGEKPKTATALPRAGRTSVGMTGVPTTAQVQGPPRSNSGPTPARVQASLQKMLGDIDRRLLTLLADREPGRRSELRLELSLLWSLRRSLAAHLAELPKDVVLLTSVAEYTDHAQAALGDLESGGAERVRRFLEHDRRLTGELAALGGAVQGLKDQVIGAIGKLGQKDADLGAILANALEVFSRLQSELDKRYPRRNGSLIDEILSSVSP